MAKENTIPVSSTLDSGVPEPAVGWPAEPVQRPGPVEYVLHRAGGEVVINDNLQRVADLLAQVIPLLEAVMQRCMPIAPTRGSGGYARSPHKSYEGDPNKPALLGAITTLAKRMVRKGLSDEEAEALLRAFVNGGEMTVPTLLTLTNWVWQPDFLAEARAKLAAVP